MTAAPRWSPRPSPTSVSTSTWARSFQTPEEAARQAIETTSTPSAFVPGRRPQDPGAADHPGLKAQGPTSSSSPAASSRPRITPSMPPGQGRLRPRNPYRGFGPQGARGNRQGPQPEPPMNLSGAGSRPCPSPTSAEASCVGQGALAKAITLIESTRADHPAAPGTARRTSPAPYRQGHSGRHFRVPGCRQIHFHRSPLGTWLIDHGHRVAVLAVIIGFRRAAPSSATRRGWKPLPARGGLHPPQPLGRFPRRVAERPGKRCCSVKPPASTSSSSRPSASGQSEITVAGMNDISTLPAVAQRRR